MSTKEAYIGIDLGTSSIKATAVAHDGVSVATVQRPLRVTRGGEEGKAEQHPDTWMDVAGQCLRQLAEELRTKGLSAMAIAATGQMDGPVLLNRDGKAFRSVPLWCDTRCTPQCEGIQSRIPDQQMLERTGHTTVTGYTAPKLLWIREHDPIAYDQATHVIFPKDYITKLLSGRIVSDYSDASNSLLMDVRQGIWDTDIIQALGLRKLALPVLHNGSDVVGAITAAGSLWSGFRQGTPVCAGVGDSIGAALGAGLSGPSVLQLVLGTAGNVNCVADCPLVDQKGRIHTGLYVDKRHWILSGVLQATGGSLAWWSDIIGRSPVELMAEVDCAARPRAVYAPYLAGERTPHLDPRVRGAFLALDASTTRAQMTQALLEGIAFSFRDAIEVFAEMCVHPQTYSLTGGLAASDLMCQIMANGLGAHVDRVTADITVRGAAILAACAAGRFTDWRQAIADWPIAGERFACTDRLVFTKAYERFRDVYPRLNQHAKLCQELQFTVGE